MQKIFDAKRKSISLFIEYLFFGKDPFVLSYFVIKFVFGSFQEGWKCLFCHFDIHMTLLFQIGSILLRVYRMLKEVFCCDDFLHNLINCPSPRVLRV